MVSLIWIWIALVVANFLPLADGGAAKVIAVLKATWNKTKKGESYSGSALNQGRVEIVDSRDGEKTASETATAKID